MPERGVVLARSRMGENALWMNLFLKGEGLVRVSAPGAEGTRARFGGGTEPFVWGTFTLRRGRSGGMYLNNVDIADDMLSLRRRPEALLTAVRWSRFLTRCLMPGHPADDLLINLYWNMRLLSVPEVPVEAADWRFLWRWLESWGLAPELARCSRCGRVPVRAAWTGEGLLCLNCAPDIGSRRPVFTGDELELLRQTAGQDTESVAQTFKNFKNLKKTGKHEKLFALASRCAAGLLQNER